MNINGGSMSSLGDDIVNSDSQSQGRKCGQKKLKRDSFENQATEKGEFFVKIPFLNEKTLNFSRNSSNTSQASASTLLSDMSSVELQSRKNSDLFSRANFESFKLDDYKPTIEMEHENNRIEKGNPIPASSNDFISVSSTEYFNTSDE